MENFRDVLCFLPPFPSGIFVLSVAFGIGICIWLSAICLCALGSAFFNWGLFYSEAMLLFALALVFLCTEGVQSCIEFNLI